MLSGELEVSTYATDEWEIMKPMKIGIRVWIGLDAISDIMMEESYFDWSFKIHQTTLLSPKRHTKASRPDTLLMARPSPVIEYKL
jgi:hypothetical protein